MAIPAIPPSAPLNVSLSPYGSLMERLALEGDDLTSGSAGASFNPSTQSVPVGTTALLVPPPGRAYFIISAVPSSLTAVRGRLQFNPIVGMPGFGSFPYSDIFWGSKDFSTTPLLLNKFIRSTEMLQGSAISCIVSQMLDNVATVGYAGCAYTGFQLADDLNFNAAKSILWLADSRGNGTGPSYDRPDLHPGKYVTTFYRSQGIDARYVLKAYSGSTMAAHAGRIARGDYDGMGKFALIVIDEGTNDASQARAPSAVVADMNTILSWRDRFQPQAKVLVIGSPPIQGAIETNLVAIRAAQAAAIAARADANVKFFSFENAFDRTVYANYVTSDPNGTAVHPANAGLLQMFNGGYSGFIGLSAWLTANMLAI